MPYNSVIDRTGAEALMPEEVAREIVQGAVEQSTVMTLGRRGQNMARGQTTMPCLSALPTAYFVNGDTGLKQTSQQAWAKKYLNAEELAVIIPIPQAVLDDSDYDIWAEVRPRAQEAIGLAFDRAVFFGDNAPASWPDDLLTGAVAAGQTVTLGAGADLAEDLLGESGVIQFLEADGFMANGHVAQMGLRGKLRSVRATTGELIFQTSMQGAGQYMLDGERIIFPRNGSMVAGDDAWLIAGDWSQLLWSVRQDLTLKLLDQAVIQDAAGNIVYNLAQQDMVALRVVARYAWQLPNPINRINTTEATRYPFAILVP